MKRNKMIHFDFKPENILISLYFKIKITDFTLTHIVHNEKEIKLTNATTCYMGKEYYQNSKIVKTENAYKVDYFGLRCILYLVIFKKHLITPPKKNIKYTEKDINKFIENGKDDLKNCKRISNELKELVLNLIDDIDKRYSVKELLKNKCAFPKIKDKISKRNKNNKINEIKNNMDKTEKIIFMMK